MILKKKRKCILHNCFPISLTGAVAQALLKVNICSLNSDDHEVISARRGFDRIGGVQGAGIYFSWG